MKKIPTLFVRDPEKRSRVLPEVTPGCEWVLAGEGRPTRKFDGTCVLVEGGVMWGRREVKPGQVSPEGFREADRDEVTGKTMGWVPVTDDPEWRWHREAFEAAAPLEDGTYELCGPKVQGNPERLERHVLIPHGQVEIVENPRDFETIREALLDHDFEGIVWWHPDGRKAKIKRKDFK